MIRKLGTVALVFATMAAGAAVEPRNYYGNIGKRVVDSLPVSHVTKMKFDDALSQRAWTNLVSWYDFDHSVFLQSDLDRFAAHEKTIDDELRNKDVSFGFEVHNLYVERLRERMDYATNLLAKAEWDFATNETYRIRRKDAPWPKTRAEAEDHWRRRMKNEVLVQRINRDLDAEEAKEKEAKKAKEKTKAKEKKAKEETKGGTNEVPAKADTPEESLIKKYRQYVTVLTEPDEEAVLQHYLSAVCRAYDPHTDYMSPATKEDFDMEMSLSLCGVGAVLSMEDGALKIV